MILDAKKNYVVSGQLLHLVNNVCRAVADYQENISFRHNIVGNTIETKGMVNTQQLNFANLLLAVGNLQNEFDSKFEFIDLLHCDFSDITPLENAKKIGVYTEDRK